MSSRLWVRTTSGGSQDGSKRGRPEFSGSLNGGIYKSAMRDMRDDSSIQYRYYNRYIDGGHVETVTISPKYQVVIPKEIRVRLGLLPGQKVQAIAYGDRIELIPVRPIRQMKGFLKGIDTSVEREADRV